MVVGGGLTLLRVLPSQGVGGGGRGFNPTTCAALPGCGWWLGGGLTLLRVLPSQGVGGGGRGFNPTTCAALPGCGWWWEGV